MDTTTQPADRERAVRRHLPLARSLAHRFLRFREELTQDAIERRVGVSQMHVSRVLCRSMGRLRDAASEPSHR